MWTQGSLGMGMQTEAAADYCLHFDRLLKKLEPKYKTPCDGPLLFWIRMAVALRTFESITVPRGVEIVWWSVQEMPDAYGIWGLKLQSSICRLSSRIPIHHAWDGRSAGAELAAHALAHLKEPVA